MTDIVERAKAALEGTTDGPWEHRVGPEDETPTEYFNGTLSNSGEPLHVLITASIDPQFAYVVPAITGDGPSSARNAEFIAAARELVPQLLAEVERLRAELALSRGGVAVRPMTEVESNLMTQVLDLRRDNARLRAVIDRVRELERSWVNAKTWDGQPHMVTCAYGMELTTALEDR